MKPKKTSYIDPILAAICLVFIVYFAVQLAACWNTAQLAAVDKADKLNILSSFMDIASVRLEKQPFTFEWNYYTKPFLYGGGLVWLMAVAYYFTTQRNYIAGKEYGTSRWGRLSDIKEMFAENIEKEEIKNAKKVGHFWTRHGVKRKAIRLAKQDSKVYLKQKLKELSYDEEMRKLEGTFSRQLHNEDVKRIKAEVAESKRLALLEAWKPDKFKAEFNDLVKAIEENPLYTAEEKETEKKKAEERYRKKLQSFYHGKDKQREIHEKYKDADMLLTKTERMSIYNYKLNNNTLILGGSGAGKTRSYVMPNILQAHSSFVITDPKGEILEKAGHFLKNIKGYKIRVLNLDDKSKSDGYNPFVYIHPERRGYEERVLSLIEAIIINTDGGEKKGSSDPFWDKAERLFLQAVFFFACDGFRESERNMNTVLALIGMLKIEEEQDNYDSDLDYFARIFEREHGNEHIGVQQFKEFREKASGKTAKSIVISTVARLAPFRTAAIRKMFEYDSLYLDVVGEEKTAIFVVVPPTDSTFNFIAGMMFTQLFQELQYCATQVHKHDGQRLPVPCRFILDEFANTCTIPNFVKILAYARSFGIGIVPILQSLEQIKTMYEKEWGVVIDNCNSLLFLGSITHMDTLEYMSKLVGKGTFDKRTTGRSRGKQGSSSQNFDVIGRELMDASEIRKLPKENCLLVVGGKDAFHSEKYDYTTHPNYRYTSDGNHSYSFDFVPEGKPIESEDAHGEQINDDVLLSPSENVIVEIEKITIDDSLQNMVNRLGRTINRQIPVSDDEMNVDDGESAEFTAQQEKDLFEALMAEDEQNERAAARIMSEETESYMSKLEQDKITVIPPEEQIIPFVKSIIHQIPAPNEELDVDDGELSETEAAEFEGYIFDDSTEDVANIDDLLGDVTDLINGIDNAAEFQSELAVVGAGNE